MPRVIAAGGCHLLYIDANNVTDVNDDNSDNAQGHRCTHGCSVGTTSQADSGWYFKDEMPTVCKRILGHTEEAIDLAKYHSDTSISEVGDILERHL